jgi:simple sugar transport system ATP-binding protein
MAKSEPAEAARVRLEGLTKRFGAFVANDRVDLVLAPGSIHGLVGENGAGKSTLMKMLYGLYRPDAGRILVDGVERRWRSPLDAIAAGIGMVHQHFMLVGEYSVLDNLVLGAEPLGKLPLPRALRPIDRDRARREIAAVAKQYGLEVPLDALVETLPVGLQQRVEILKALYRRARVLILDEPTAVLTPLETRELFNNLRRLAAEGCSIVIITHKLREVLELCDAITVMRASRVAGTADPKKVTEQELATLMVGKDVTLHVEVAPATPRGDAVLQLQGVSHPSGKLREVDVDVRAGEIVGIAGVEGNGQSELVDVILCPALASAGSVRLLGQDARRFGARNVRALGVGVIPEDRHRQGLLLGFSADENCLLGYEDRPELRRAGLLSRAAVRAHARRIFDAFDVRPRDLDRTAGAFSGGNQQKLIIGRELAHAPRFVIAARPTRGVDVGAIELIHRRLVRARDEGAGILLVSADLDEILALSDRIVVLYAGRVAATFARGDVTLEKLGVAMGGGGGARHG